MFLDEFCGLLQVQKSWTKLELGSCLSFGIHVCICGTELEGEFIELPREKHPE